MDMAMYGVFVLTSIGLHTQEWPTAGQICKFRRDISPQRLKEETGMKIVGRGH